MPAAEIYVPDRESAEYMGLEAGLRARGYDVRVGTNMNAGAEEIAAGIGEAEIVCVAMGHVTAEVMDHAPNLRLIAKTGIGVDNIEVEAARERGIPVIRTGNVNQEGVAEYLLGATIALYRRFAEIDAAMREGNYQPLRGRYSGRLPALTGKTLGILGYGAIGKRLAKLAAPHELRMIALDPYADQQAADEAGVELVPKDTFFREADIVAVAAVLTPETHHLVGAAELAAMRPSSVLVNGARGPIVDEAALTEALRSRQIAGAALDVFEVEPLPGDSPLLELDNVLLTPHLAGTTDYGYERIGARVVELIDLFLNGGRLPPDSIVVDGSGIEVAR